MLAIINSTLLMGDFILDWRNRKLKSFVFKNYFDDKELIKGDMKLNQLVS
jgi:hypothetical protein